MSTSPKLLLNSLLFQDIAIGSAYSFERYIDAALVESFAQISGDYNPLHMDEAYCARTKFGGRIVHGMLLASFFSALVGMLCPGRGCLYLSQDIRFKKPLMLNQWTIVKGTVTAKSEATNMVVLATVITDKNGVILVEGEAKVQVQTVL